MIQGQYFAEQQHGRLGKLVEMAWAKPLKKAMQREKDEEVLHEMNRGLELLAQKKSR